MMNLKYRWNRIMMKIASRKTISQMKMLANLLALTILLHHLQEFILGNKVKSKQESLASQ